MSINALQSYDNSRKKHKIWPKNHIILCYFKRNE